MWQNGTQPNRDECVVTGEQVLSSNSKWVKDAKAQAGAGNREGFLRSGLNRSEWSENYSLHPVACCCFTTVSAVLPLGGFQC